MSAIAIFSFENSQVRTTGTAENPLFVAIDIATVLGYSNARKAVYAHVDEEDRLKATVETEGGKQEVVCVNESGLYALIFGSKLESAKRFKRWVTNEVLPAIRKRGRYECPAQAQLPPPVLTEAHAFEVLSEVAKRCKRNGVHYQTVYRALKARYQVTKYTNIPDKYFEDAIEFIRTVDLKTPVPTDQLRNDPKEEEHEEEGVWVPVSFIERQQRFVYEMRYLFRECFVKFHRFLQLVDSPLAGRFYEMYTSLNLVGIENELTKLGYPVSDIVNFKRTPRSNVYLA